MIEAKRLPTSRSRPRLAHREAQSTFHGLTFAIDPGRAFTPRATTERLVDAALARVAGRSVRLVDVGTGVGVVAITLALRAPNAEVWASDTSDRALELTAANAKRLGAEINLVKGDLVEHVPTGLDLIVANLPYLSPGTAGYEDEPETSVFSTGDGLDHYRRLLTAARYHLVDDGGVLIQFDGEVLEAHRSQLRELRATLEAQAAGRATQDKPRARATGEGGGSALCRLIALMRRRRNTPLPPSAPMTNVRANTSVTRLRPGTTLCDDAWPEAQVDFFQRRDGGKPR